MNRILGRAIYQLRKCKMRHVEANPKANLAFEASEQVAAGMRTNTQSKILYTRQHLQGRGAAPTYMLTEWSIMVKFSISYTLSCWLELNMWI